MRNLFYTPAFNIIYICLVLPFFTLQLHSMETLVKRSPAEKFFRAIKRKKHNLLDLQVRLLTTIKYSKNKIVKYKAFQTLMRLKNCIYKTIVMLAPILIALTLFYCKLSILSYIHPWDDRSPTVLDEKFWIIAAMTNCILFDITAFAIIILVFLGTLGTHNYITDGKDLKAFGFIDISILQGFIRPLPALSRTVKLNQIENVKFLLNKWNCLIDWDAKDTELDKYMRPIDYALKNNNFEITQLFLDKLDFYQIEEAFIKAIQFACNSNIIQLFINEEVDVNMKNNNKTPLVILAAQHSAVEALKILLENGADTSIRDSDNKTLYHYTDLHPQIENVPEMKKILKEFRQQFTDLIREATDNFYRHINSESYTDPDLNYGLYADVANIVSEHLI